VTGKDLKQKNVTARPIRMTVEIRWINKTFHAKLLKKLTATSAAVLQ
jgi:hypothetical protein